jgi:hypothetical protein
MKLEKRNKFGLEKRLSKAISEINATKRNINGEGTLMTLRFLVSDNKHEPLTVFKSSYTGCTAGCIFPGPIMDFDIESDNKIRYITSQLPKCTVEMFKNKEGNHKEAYKFYHWLFNDSPYRKAYVVKSVEKVVDIGHVIVRGDLDNRIVAEALMCTRYIWESWCKNYCKLFSLLVDNGVSGNLAFQTTYLIKASDRVFFSNTTWGHSAPQNNMDNSETLARFVCDKGMLKQDLVDYYNHYCLGDVLRTYDRPRKPKKLTFSNVGGFISGCVSKGWGKRYRAGQGAGFDVKMYIQNFVSMMDSNREVSTNLFGKAFLKFIGTNTNEKPLNKENISTLSLFLINLEKHLRDGTVPNDY